MAFACNRFLRSTGLEAAANNTKPLRRGDRGEAVEILQQALLDLGFAMPISTTQSKVPDGVFGAETDKAVRGFQSQNQLTPDGVVGRNTLTRLDQLFAASEAAARLKMVAAANAPAPLNPWHLT